MRHPTKQAIDKFNKIFDIEPAPYSQDWEIEYSDPARLDEYIECYNNQTENDDERFT